jgi:alkanesulfonate monooxygenase SsuD/methylene tetrahydromethanopterin reductase-like flavin-dependent oxidoreductase (luciferase family)
VVAQKAATLQILAEGRFTLGLGSGENLNEHVVGDGWPAIQTRQAMLRGAVEIILELRTGELVDYRGDYFEVDSARLWDVPDEAAVARAHEQFRWFGGGWSVNADLPTPAGCAGATQFVRPEDVADAIPCGPDLDQAAGPLLERLRAASA